ncbi:MAG: hypothetical protein LUI87_15075 [Lachnospiraceae bacterium]|nr:hypothetical protein [Lachnospiraceae bacterium]
MSALDGFKPFNFNEGVPYVSVTYNGMTFNKSVVMKLGFPKHVVLLIDEESKQIAIKICDESYPNATTFYRGNNPKVISVRWNGRDLLNTIQSMMSWDLSKCGYRTEGTLLKEEGAMLFNLAAATELK